MICVVKEEKQQDEHRKQSAWLKCNWDAPGTRCHSRQGKQVVAVSTLTEADIMSYLCRGVAGK